MTAIRTCTLYVEAVFMLHRKTWAYNNAERNRGNDCTAQASVLLFHPQRPQKSPRTAEQMARFPLRSDSYL